jgi:hypothetical protein
MMLKELNYTSERKLRNAAKMLSPINERKASKAPEVSYNAI